MIRSDCHVHTVFSPDSDAPLQAVAESACQKGLEILCITDHDDYGYEAEGIGAMKNTEEYVESVQKLREEYEGRLDIRLGIEMGMQPHLGEYFSKLTQTHPFDFVISSMHIIQGKDPYFGELFDSMSDDDVFRLTFRSMTECVRKIPDFDVVGHLDYIVRYGSNGVKNYDCNRLTDEIDELLKTLIDMGKGIEINTSGLKYLGFCHPHMDILKRYRELGGEILTIGSDAHTPEAVAKGFDIAEKVLRSCGYKYYTCFQDRKPFFTKI